MCITGMKRMPHLEEFVLFFMAFMKLTLVLNMHKYDPGAQNQS